MNPAKVSPYHALKAFVAAARHFTSTHVESALPTLLDTLHLHGGVRWQSRELPCQGCAKCVVPWKQVLHKLPEGEFRARPEETVRQALALLKSDGHARMRQMWEAQREAAPDVMWHLPSSRVAHNILEQAARCLHADSQITY